MTRTFNVQCALGDQVEFRSLSGVEQIGGLFVFDVGLISSVAGIPAKSLLGQDLSVEIDLTTLRNGSGKRYLSGQVTSFVFCGRDGDYYSYRAQVRPWLWLATRRTDFRIFQRMTVPEIIKDVLRPYGFVIDDKLCRSYRRWEYCVQYDESDFNFISRLLEHEGAYYFFNHGPYGHHLVLADDIGSHGFVPNGPTVLNYYPGNRAAQVRDEDYIDDWNGAEDVASGRYYADDYDFTQPGALLDTQQAAPAGHSQDGWEVYAWPGGYTQVSDGQNYALARMEQLATGRESVIGQGNARNLAPGCNFTLSGYPDSQYNQTYLITAVNYDFTENVRRSDGAGGSGAKARAGTDSPTRYRVALVAVPQRVRYRALTHGKKPRTLGPQTATVTGPPGEEIWTDQYGRVTVKFHWDRYGASDQNSSCWIRVSQNWAGDGFGAMHIPRVGQEVIVDFLNGDPDQPIITGRVYNAMQMPPWDLPGNKTQSGIKTRSSKGGSPGPGLKNGPGTANALRFEDKVGAEQLWLHAQKDQLTEVEHDEEKWVGNDRDKTIDGNERNTIHKNRTEIVDLDEDITIHGNRTERVDKNEDVTVHQNRQKTIDHNETDKIGDNWHVTVGQNKQETVALTYMENTGIAKMMNIGIAYSRNVGFAMNSLVGLLQAGEVGLIKQLMVGQSYSIKVGQSMKLEVGETRTEEIGQVSISKVGAHLELVCGKARIVLTSEGGIYLKGTHIELQGERAINGDASMVRWNCEATQGPPDAPTGGQAGPALGS